MPTRVESGGYVHGMPCIDEIYGENQRFFMGKNVVFQDVKVEEEKGLRKNLSLKNVSYSDESSSSIGRNSDLSENSLEKSGDGEEEVQSSYKGPLNAMEALEEVLPIRRGISAFYNGKSKSFASLADASRSSSIKDIAKPDNALMRKRRNLIASNLAWDKTRSSSFLRSNGGGISKRVTNSSRTNLALAVAINNCEESAMLLSSSPRKDFYSYRSYSLADLQQCVSSVANLNQLSTKPTS